jgi:hypothetical protein
MVGAGRLDIDEMALTLFMHEFLDFSSQAVLTLILMASDRMATLLLMKKNNVLEHPRPENPPEHSNVFIGAVYIKDFSSYAHSVGCSQDPDATNIDYREPQPRVAVQRACFDSVGESRWIVGSLVYQLSPTSPLACMSGMSCPHRLSKHFPNIKIM